MDLQWHEITYLDRSQDFNDDDDFDSNTLDFEKGALDEIPQFHFDPPPLNDDRRCLDPSAYKDQKKIIAGRNLEERRDSQFSYVEMNKGVGGDVVNHQEETDTKYESKGIYLTLHSI